MEPMNTEVHNVSKQLDEIHSDRRGILVPGKEEPWASKIAESG